MTPLPDIMRGKLFRMAQLASFVLTFLVSCSSHDTGQTADDWIARVGNSYLTADEVADAVPAGLSEDDSLKYVKAYVGNWVDSRLITDFAAEEVDMDLIDQMVEEYRRDLIVSFYRRGMFESHAASIPDDSVAAYYAEHPDARKLERAMVKGVYLKLPKDAKNLRTVRRLYTSDSPADIDKLEKEVLSSAIHYDYFRDRWVDWEQIENRIPFDFGDSPSTWLAHNRRLDFSAGGFTYLLSIVDVLPEGSDAPLEAVRQDVIDMMLRRDRQAYNARLDRQLREQAIEKGRLEIRDFSF